MLIDYADGKEKTINGVVLPHNVVRELQKLGRALEWYSAGELQSAAVACAVDGNLIDDEHGVNFTDKLELTEAEKQKRKESESPPDCEEEQESCGAKIFSFCRRLKEGRKNHNHGFERKLCSYS